MPQLDGQMFLASHLGELNIIDDEHEKATTAIATISAVYDNKIGETVLLTLLSQVSFSDSTKLAAISYFRGAELLNVACDCYDSMCGIVSVDTHFWFERGLSDKENNTYAYRSTNEWINNLKTKLI